MKSETDARFQYEGKYQNGKANGWGKCTYPSGVIYEGLWLDGKEQGWGSIHLQGGTTVEGEWINGEWYGEGDMSYVGLNTVGNERPAGGMAMNGLVSLWDTHCWDFRSV